MRDRIAELQVASGSKGASDALESECRRLRADLQEKERELLKTGDQMR